VIAKDLHISADIDGVDADTAFVKHATADWRIEGAQLRRLRTGPPRMSRLTRTAGGTPGCQAHCL
jgi:hypothetical protein